jgi:hypothetical protein
MRIDLEHWPSMELQEPRHHASRLSGTRKLATYFIAALILFTMAVWFSVISSVGTYRGISLLAACRSSGRGSRGALFPSRRQIFKLSYRTPCCFCR